MWTCTNCTAWNEKEQIYCAGCGARTGWESDHEPEERQQARSAEISAILYGPKVAVPDDVNWGDVGGSLGNPFDYFEDEDAPF